MLPGQIKKYPQQRPVFEQSGKARRKRSAWLKWASEALYGKTATTGNREASVPLFGLNIDNLSMQEAIAQVVSRSPWDHPRRVTFINVNSIEQCAGNPMLYQDLQQADYRFADGSGMRIAARVNRTPLVDNVNGTDMLPLLCERCERTGQSLFLFGAKPGVADGMADNLTLRFPKLKVVGTASGYVSPDEYPALVERINRAAPDIVLVALGTPHQERWLATHAEHLHCHTVMAVGGLFDFYSGHIPRAPLWMRELGMEWVWRLCQEPMAKGYRYLVGNPLFLLRLFFTNQAKRGF